jgi:carbon monoxide dehydrogenase subunit G
MDVVEQFTVTRPIEDVWQLFRDVPELARCLPGAELTADNGDGTYEGSVSVKLGPISASFDGKATVEHADATHTSTIKGRGVDRSGGSQGQVVVDVALTEDGQSRTGVAIAAKVTLAGPIAQFGRTGLINEVSKRLIDEFSECLHKKLDAGSPAEAEAIEASDVRGLSLVFTSAFASIVEWWKRIFSRSGS